MRRWGSYWGNYVRPLSPLRIDAPRAVAALTRFLELSAVDRRDRATRELQRDLQARMDSALTAQGRHFRRGLVGLKAKWQESPGTIWPGDWIPYFDDAARLTREVMEAGLYDNILSALFMGAGHLVDDMGIPLTIAFNLENPLAVAYAVTHAGLQVTRINAATMEGISQIISAAVENGTSYTQVMRQLQDAYEFSTGRAQRIAVFEMGDAYEAGKRTAIDELTRQGLVMEKSWISAGDEKVRPEHRSNQARGWIGVGELFPSGHDRPPTDPGCRCAVVYRMAR